MSGICPAAGSSQIEEMCNQQAEFREYEYRIYVKGTGFSLYDDDARADADALWRVLPDEQLIAVGDRVVSVRAEHDKYVRVLVDVSELEPTDHETNLALVGEGSLDVPSGRIVIAGSADCFPDAARIPVRPALYRLKVYAGSLDTIYGGLRRSQDHYRVVLWLF